MTTLQDSQGFVWLGTEDGLVRFDGHELLPLRALAHRAAARCPATTSGRSSRTPTPDLWIALEGRRARAAGIARTDTLHELSPRPERLRARSRATACAPCSSMRAAWSGSARTMPASTCSIPSSGRIEHLRHDAERPELARERPRLHARRSTAPATSGSARDGGLNRWHSETRTMARAGPPPGDAHSLRDKPISRVLEDQSGTLWIGTFEAGLVRMDRDGRVLETFRHDARDAASLGSDDVRALLEDQSGRFWVGTADGLALLDRSTGAFSHYRHDANDNASLRNSFVMSLYQDPAGLVWIGTRTGGVSRWNPRSWELGGHRPALARESSPSRRSRTRRTTRCGSRRSRGLVRFDAATGAVTPIDTLVGRQNARRRGARDVAAAGSSRRAVDRHDGQRAQESSRRTGRIESIPVQPGDPRSLSTDLHHGDPRVAQRRDLDRHVRRRRERPRSGHAQRFGSCRTALRRPARSAQRSSRRSSRTRAATSGSAPTAAGSISRAPTARC